MFSLSLSLSQSVSGATLNEHFFKSHILQSSPYFKEEYVTLNGQCVIYRNGSISTKTGFTSPRKVYVLGEELFYTENFKSFTVYSISAPLVGLDHDDPVHSPSPSSSSSNARPFGHHGPSHRLRSASSSSSIHRHLPPSSSSMLSPSPSHSDGHRKSVDPLSLGMPPIGERSERHWQCLLSMSLPPALYKSLMEETVSFGDQFNRSYVMIKGYTKSAALRIDEFRANTLGPLLAADHDAHSLSAHSSGSRTRSKSKARSSSKMATKWRVSGHRRDELQCALDSYLNHLLFDRIFSSFLVRQYKAEDAVFRRQLTLLRTLSQSEIGIKGQFQSDDQFESAVTHLAAINAVKTPKQKLGVLQQTMQRIRGCIEVQNAQNLQSHSSKSNGLRSDSEAMALTTDDMLSLFTFVLIHSEMEHIESENEYVQHFYFPLDCTAHLTYFAATLAAAIQYCKESLFQKQEPKLHRKKSTNKRPKVVKLNRFGRSKSNTVDYQIETKHHRNHSGNHHQKSKSLQRHQSANPFVDRNTNHNGNRNGKVNGFRSTNPFVD